MWAAGLSPTELFDETGEVLCRLGHEFGAVTGRKRRCGWLDMVALKYAIMVDGVTKLIMMKADVMNDFDTIKVAEAYEIDGRRVTEFPYDIQDDVKPVYREFKGWKTDLKQVRRYEDFPAEFKDLCGIYRTRDGRARGDHFGRARPRRDDRPAVDRRIDDIKILNIL